MSILIVPVRMLYTLSRKPLCGWDHKLWWWLVTNVVLIWILVVMARSAWHETMGMLAFQARRSSFEIGDTEKRSTANGSTLDCD